jgi:hypothetical protein
MTHFLSSATLAVAAALTLSSAASAGILERAPALDPGTVTARSPGVTPRQIGKEVAPNVFQIDPARLAGRRLILSPSPTRQDYWVCYGTYNTQTGECKGVFINYDPKNPN